MLASLLRRALTPVESRDQALGAIVPGTALFDTLTGGVASTAGPAVSSDSALRQATVMACVRLIAESIGSLPRRIYRRSDAAREELRYPGDSFLWGVPNDVMLGQPFWENVVAHLLLYGNAYIYTERNDLGRVTSIWPLAPHRCQPVLTNPLQIVEPTIVYLVDGEPYDGQTVLHIPGFGVNGLTGVNPITFARQTLGLALAQEDFGARFYAQGATMSGVLTTDHTLPQETIDRLSAAWKAAHSGTRNAFKTAILEGGLKWTATSVSPADAQYLDGRTYSRREIAALFRVPPHLIGDMEKSTSWGTGLEVQNTQFVMFTLLPWLTRIEEGVSERLLSQPDRVMRFDVRALMRGTMADRYAAYNIGRNGGWFSVNDIRRLEDMPPVPDGDGRLQPLNMAPLGTVPASSAGAGTLAAPDATAPADATTGDQAGADAATAVGT